MSRRRVTSLVLAAVVVGLQVMTGASPVAAAGSQGDVDAPRVLVVSLPRVTWEAIGSERPPELTAFLENAAVASMSTRTVGPRTESGDAYLTIGAGNRADALSAATAGDASQTSESTPSGSAAEVYRRRTGIDPTGEVVVLSIAEQIARNDALLYDAAPGALAGALAERDLVMGVVGNADAGITDAVPQRDVALAAMTRDGQVATGNVSSSLLIGDPLAPFGVRTDAATLRAATELAWESSDVLLVEMSDLERADEARAESTVEQGDEQFRSALLRSDALFGELLSTVDPTHDLVMVVAPTAPVAGEQLTVFGMQGPGVDAGWARSPTTRRAGFVTLTDVAPTILDAFGIDPPKEMNDTPIVPVGGGSSLGDRIDTMERDNQRALMRDEATGPITVAFIITLVVLLLAVMYAVARAPSWRRPLAWCCLAVTATPAMMFLSGLLPYDPFSVSTFGLAIVAASVALAAAAAVLGGFDTVAPPVIVCAVAVSVLGVDIVTGGNLQLNTVFGYSPIVAGRFAGYGNQAFSILTISALVVVAGGWEIWKRRRPDSSDAPRVIVSILVFAVVVVLDGSPFWGSDVGGVLASIPAFTVCVLLLAGVKVRARLVVLIGACTVGVLVAFAAIDLARPVDSRTHLGRFAQKLLDGDGALILQRKLNANISILSSTVWTLVIPVALLFVGYLTWRPNGLMRRMQAEHHGFRAFGVSGLTLGLLAWAVNDSGVAIPALMLTIALPYTAYLALGLTQRAEAPDDGTGRDDETGTEEERALGSSVPV